MAGSSTAPIELSDDDDEHGAYDKQLELLSAQHRAATQQQKALNDVVDLSLDDADDDKRKTPPSAKRRKAAVPAGDNIIDVDVVEVKLVVDDGAGGKECTFRVHGDTRLAYLFSTTAVRRLATRHKWDASSLASAFELFIRGSGVIAGGALHVTTFAQAFGDASKARVDMRRRGSGGGIQKGVGIVHAGCDEVFLLRLGLDHDSPVVHIKNFGKDQGRRLLSSVGIDDPSAVGQTAVRRQPLVGRMRSLTDKLYEAADRVLDLAEEAARRSGRKHSQPSADALHQRTPYFSALPLFYPAGTTLHRHIDGGNGQWLVLFSFGYTVRFFVGDKTVLFESGDALVFKGSTVMHGVDETLDHATYKGKRCQLAGAEFAVCENMRLSLQARQQ